MPTCKELARLVASDELTETGLARRFGARLHLLMCSHCRRYANQIRRLGQAARSLGAAHLDEDHEVVGRLERNLLARISGRPDS